MPDPAERSAPDIDRSTRLAYDRTRLAYDRTMLAWVRTGTSLITFGFGIYNLRRLTTGITSGAYVIAQYEFALIMVGVGLVALLLATVEYRFSIRALYAQCPDLPRSKLPLAVGSLISGLGILALIVMAFRQ
jgi:putative membrane protein